MTILAINGNASAWNYNDPTQQDYQPTIQGTVVQIKEVQHRNFKTKQPEFWPGGNPKLDVSVIIADQAGREYNWQFAPKSTAFDAVVNALGPNATTIAELGGKFIQLQTWEPQGGGKWGTGNPRPWIVQILGEGQVPYRGTVEFNAAQAQQPAQQPAPQQQGNPVPAQQPPAQQPQYQQAPVQQQPVPQQQYQQAPVQQQPVQQQPVVNNYNPAAQMYDQDIPF